MGRCAGADVGFISAGRIVRPAIAALSFPGLEPVAHVVAERPCDFRYVPGLLSFREVPVLLQALERLSVWPDLVLCDGRGYAHPGPPGPDLPPRPPRPGAGRAGQLDRVAGWRGDDRCGAPHPDGGPAALRFGRTSRAF
jgi:hypothetical protein